VFTCLVVHGNSMHAFRSKWKLTKHND
jgi:hypothetical protein